MGQCIMEASDSPPPRSFRSSVTLAEEERSLKSWMAQENSPEGRSVSRREPNCLSAGKHLCNSRLSLTSGVDVPFEGTPEDSASALGPERMRMPSLRGPFPQPARKGNQQHRPP
jgi:hypothetical protein